MALEVSRVLVGAHDDPILCVAYNAVNREVWTGCQGGKIRCWEEKTGTLIQEVSGAHRAQHDDFFLPPLEPVDGVNLQLLVRA